MDDFISVITDWQTDTMVVGHLPFMDRLVADLLRNDADMQSVVYQPGSVACLEKIEDGHWSLVWMVRPELVE